MPILKLLLFLAADVPATPDPVFSGLVVHALPYLFAGLAMVLSWALVALQKKLGAQTNQTALATMGAKVAHFAEIVVHDIEATLRPTVKDISADGTISRAEATRLREEAIKRVKELLGDVGIGQLRSAFGLTSPPQIERLIGGEVEKAVAELPQ